MVEMDLLGMPLAAETQNPQSPLAGRPLSILEGFSESHHLGKALAIPLGCILGMLG